MFHLVAFYNSALAAVANTAILPVADQTLQSVGNGVRLVDQMQVVGAYAGSATCTRSRLDSPTLRIPGNPQILPIQPALLPVDRQKVMDLSQRPYLLPVREEIDVQSTATGVGEHHYAALWLQQSIVPAPPGRIQWVRATSTGAAVVGSWAQIAYTFDAALPSGFWAMVGSECQSTNAIMHRWIFPGQYYRPGFLSRTAEGNYSYGWNYDGRLGEMGRFVNDNPPLLQVLADVADASHIIYVGLVQVGSL